MSFYAPHIARLKIEQRRTGQIATFTPNSVQRDFLARMENQAAHRGRIRIIVLKARQMGLSTATQGVMFTHAMNLDNYTGITVAHDDDTALSLLRKDHTFWAHYPLREFYTTKNDKENVLSWMHGSRLEIATAGNRKAGRGKTHRALHLSELAFYPDAKKFCLGLLQSVPTEDQTLIVMESTANGIGDYFNLQWEAACSGELDYEPVFYPWFAYEDYRYTVAHRTRDIPALGPLDEDERCLRLLGVDDDQLAWRRWAIRSLCGGDILLFHQEYPASAEEAFISTGHNVYPLEKLQAIYRPMVPKVGRLTRQGDHVVFHEDATGPLKIYRDPSRDRDWGIYQVGADPTRTTDGDFAVGQVISRRTMEQCAVFRQRMDPRNFGEEMFKLGIFYNQAQLAVEKQGPGALTIGALLGAQYPNMWMHSKMEKTPGNIVEDNWGWQTTVQGKEVAIGQLLAFVVDGLDARGFGLLLHDADTFREMKNYVKLPDGNYGNADGESHDDTVMALAIAAVTHVLSPTLRAYGEGWQDHLPAVVADLTVSATGTVELEQPPNTYLEERLAAAGFVSART